MKRILAIILLCLFTLKSPAWTTNFLSDLTVATISNACATAGSNDWVVLPAGTNLATTCIIISNALTLISSQQMGLTNAGTYFIYNVNQANYPTAPGNIGQSLFSAWNATRVFSVRFSGFTVLAGTTNYSNSGDGVIQIFQGSSNIVDHVTMGAVNNRGYEFYNGSAGIASHITNNYTANGQPFLFRNGNYNGGVNGNDAWANASPAGASNMTNTWYIEDSSFMPDTNNYVGICDSWDGGGYVLRFCYMNGYQIHFGNHGTESPQNERSGRLVEAYDNYVTNTSSFDHCIEMRGGLLMAFNNRFDGPFSSTSSIMKGSAYRTASWDPPYGTADGLKLWDRSMTTNGTSMAGGDATGIFSSGTLTGGNTLSGGASATNSAANWTANQWVNYTLRAFTNFTASSATANTVTVTGAGWTTNQWVQWEFYDVSLTSNNCSLISANTGDTITFNSNFNYPSVSAGHTIQFSHADIINFNNTTNITTSAPHDGSVVPYAAGQIYEIRLLDSVLDTTGKGSSAVPSPTSRPGNQSLGQTNNGPTYVWLNTNLNSGVSTLLPFAGNLSIQTNRDFYQQGTNFDGTSGVGIGTFASMPAHGTPGVGYWATDKGSWNTKLPANTSGQLYIANASSNFTLAYVPLTYPHPLAPPNGGIVTNLNLSASPSPSTNGVSVTFSATVTTNYVTASDATGTMYYFDGATLLATNGVTSGVGSYSTSALTVGTHTIGFGYNGNYGTNWNTLTQIVYSNYVPPTTNSSAAGTASTTGAIMTGVSFNSTPRTVYYMTTSANGWLDTTNWMAGTISFPLDGSTPTNFDFNVSKIPSNVDIQLLPGTYQHNVPILMKSGQNIYGSGMYSSILQWPATNLSALATITGTNAIVSDLTIDDNYQTGTNITMAGIHLGGTGSKIHNVCLANCASVTATNGAYSESFGLMVVGNSNSEISGCVVTNYTANMGLAWNNMSAIGLWGSGCKVLNNTVYEKAGSPVFAYGVIGDTATCSNNTSIGTKIGYHSDTPGGVTNLTIINSLFTNVACAMFFANSVDKNVNFLSNTVSLNNTNTSYGTFALFGENTGTYTNVLVAGNTFILTTNFTGGPVLYYGYNLDHLTMTNNWMSTSFTNILTSCTSTVVTNNFNLSGGSYNP